MGMYGFENIPHGPDHWQTIHNQSWPLVDEHGKRHARGIPRTSNPINVEVRILFDVDGEQWLNGLADGWHGQHVGVLVTDVRVKANRVWVDASDVKRR